jgi:hypothetical protein
MSCPTHLAAHTVPDHNLRHAPLVALLKEVDDIPCGGLEVMGRVEVVPRRPVQRPH